LIYDCTPHILTFFCHVSISTPHANHTLIHSATHCLVDIDAVSAESPHSTLMLSAPSHLIQQHITSASMINLPLKYAARQTDTAADPTPDLNTTACLMFSPSSAISTSARRMLATPWLIAPPIAPSTSMLSVPAV
jgi:hypothetical protein